LPIEEADTTSASDAEKCAAKEAVRLKRYIECMTLLEISVQFYARCAFSDRIVFVILFTSPCEVEATTERLIAKRQ
jgi:hypothetical protein